MAMLNWNDYRSEIMESSLRVKRSNFSVDDVDLR
jgi:hypothetical protein